MLKEFLGLWMSLPSVLSGSPQHFPKAPKLRPGRFAGPLNLL